MISTDIYQAMEEALAMPAGPEAARVLCGQLSHADWRVRYAALVALGDRREEGAVEAIAQLLREEDAAPLYLQPEVKAGAHAGATHSVVPDFGRPVTPEELDAWRRRGRLKQAACLALRSIGQATPDVVTMLERYATDSAEDYMVRAAACQALGAVGGQRSVPALQTAAQDEEWCTKTEAAKALSTLQGRAFQ